MSAEDRIYDFSKLKSISKKILAGDMQLNNLLVRYIAQTKKKGQGAVYFRLDKYSKVVGNGIGFDKKIETAKEKALKDCRTFFEYTNCYLIAVNDKVVFTGKVNNFYVHNGNIISKNEFLSLEAVSSVDNSQLNESATMQIDGTVNEMATSDVAEETSESSGIQENSEEPYYSVIVDGTELSVNLEELIQGYQRNYENKSSNIRVRLKELKSMLDEGLISQEDYDKKKSEYLKDY